MLWQAEKGELRPETEEDYSIRAPLRIVVADSAKAASAVARENNRRGAACRKSGAAAPQWALSLDLDFFSTRNPAQRSLPFDAFPSFRLALWRLACATPIGQGNQLYAALDRLLDGDLECDEAIAAVEAAACGTAAEPRPTPEVVANIVAAVPQVRLKPPPRPSPRAQGLA